MLLATFCDEILDRIYQIVMEYRLYKYRIAEFGRSLITMSFD